MTHSTEVHQVIHTVLELAASGNFVTSSIKTHNGICSSPQTCPISATPRKRKKNKKIRFLLRTVLSFAKIFHLESDGSTNASTVFVQPFSDEEPFVEVEVDVDDGERSNPAVVVTKADRLLSIS